LKRTSSGVVRRVIGGGVWCTNNGGGHGGFKENSQGVGGAKLEMGNIPRTCKVLRAALKKKIWEIWGTGSRPRRAEEKLGTKSFRCQKKYKHSK